MEKKHFLSVMMTIVFSSLALFGALPAAAQEETPAGADTDPIAELALAMTRCSCAITTARTVSRTVASLAAHFSAKSAMSCYPPP